MIYVAVVRRRIRKNRYSIIYEVIRSYRDTDCNFLAIAIFIILKCLKYVPLIRLLDLSIVLNGSSNELYRVTLLIYTKKSITSHMSKNGLFKIYSNIAL